MSSPDSTGFSCFYANELNRALSEQHFGIQAYSILNSEPYSALASVSLLEGQKIHVSLTNRGYSIEEGNSTVFETLDALLQSVSARYEQQRQQQLTRKLEMLSGLDL